MDREAWQATVHGAAKAETAEHTHTHTHTHTATKAELQLPSGALWPQHPAGLLLDITETC